MMVVVLLLVVVAAARGSATRPPTNWMLPASEVKEDEVLGYDEHMVSRLSTITNSWAPECVLGDLSVKYVISEKEDSA
jgi:hypothetical protein